MRFWTSNVNPWLGIILLRGLRGLVAGKKHIEETDIPAMHIPLIRKYQELGWNQLWYSKWTKRWNQCRLQYAREQTPRITNFERWIPRIIQLIWEYTHARWAQRGKVINVVTTPKGPRGLSTRVRKLYAIRHHLPKTFQLFFKQDMEEKIHQPLERTRRWIQDTEPLLRKALRTAQRKREGGTRKWVKLTRRVGAMGRRRKRG